MPSMGSSRTSPSGSNPTGASTSSTTFNHTVNQDKLKIRNSFDTLSRSISICRSLEGFAQIARDKASRDMNRRETTIAACNVGEATYRNITKNQFWFMIATLSLAMVTAGLQAEIIGDAASTIAQRFQAQSQITWMASSGFLVQVCTLLIFGKIYDFLEPKRVILVSCLCFTTGSIISAKAANFEVLIIGQAVAGLGRSGIVVGAILMLGIITTSQSQRAFFISVVSGGYGLMLKIAPIVAGLLLEKQTQDRWRWIFWIAVPFQALLLILFSNFPILRRRRATWDQCRHFDFIGAILQAAGLATFVVPLLIGQPRGRDSWTSPSLISLYVISPILSASFIYWDSKKIEKDRYLPLFAIRNNRSIPALGAITMGSSIIISAATFYLPSYLQIVRDSSPLKSAVQQLPSVVLGSLASVIVGKCLPLGGPRTHQLICVIGSLLQIIGGFVFWFFKPNVPWSLYYFDGIIVATGAGMLFAIGITLVLEMVPEQAFGQVSAFMNVCTAMGSVLGVSIQGVLLQAGTEQFLVRNGATNLVARDFTDYQSARDSSILSRSSLNIDIDVSNLTLQYKEAYHDTQRQASLMFCATGVLSLLASLMLAHHKPCSTARRSNRDTQNLNHPENFNKIVVESMSQEPEESDTSGQDFEHQIELRDNDQLEKQTGDETLETHSIPAVGQDLKSPGLPLEEPKILCTIPSDIPSQSQPEIGVSLPARTVTVLMTDEDRVTLPPDPVVSFTEFSSDTNEQGTSHVEKFHADPTQVEKILGPSLQASMAAEQDLDKSDAA